MNYKYKKRTNIKFTNILLVLIVFVALIVASIGLFLRLNYKYPLTESVIRTSWNPKGNENNILAASTERTPSCIDSQYYGMNVDMSQIVPDSPYFVRNNDGKDLLDILSDLGANVVRITNSRVAFQNNLTYSKDQWNVVLNKIQRLHMKAVILIESPTQYDPILNGDYFSLLNTYINDYDLTNHQAVYAIDIKNEPYLTKENVSQLEKARAIVKSKNPNVLVTIGGWRTIKARYFWEASNQDLWNRPEDVNLIDGVVDLVSVHLYGFDDYQSQVANSYDYALRYLSQIRTYTSKPIVIGEFGSGNGEYVTDQLTIGSKQLQKNTYYGVFYATRKLCNNGIMGAVGYALYPRDFHAQGWNIIDNSGNVLFPATEAFNWQDPVFNLDKPFIPLSNIPKNYMLQDNANNPRITIKVGDSVAVVLSGNSNFQLTTDSDRLEIRRNISYQPQVNKSTAILVGRKIGTFRVEVNGNGGEHYSYSINVK